MAVSTKPVESAIQDENEDEEEEEEEEEIEENKIEETKDELINNDEENEPISMDDVQQPTLSVAEKLQALGKKPAPFSKTTAK